MFKRGQATIEYLLLIGALVLAMIFLISGNKTNFLVRSTQNINDEAGSNIKNMKENLIAQES